LEVFLSPWTVFTLLSCSGGDPVVVPDAPPAEAPFALTPGLPAGFPELRTRHSEPLLLHRLDAEMTWPPVERPARLRGAGDAFVVEAEPLPNPRHAPRVLRLFRARLPFSVDPDDRVFRPEGMSVTVDGVSVPFSRVPAPVARQSTWRIAGRDLVLTHPVPPGEVRIAYPGVTEALAQWDPDAARGDLSAHARGELTLGGHTRSGLRLPAPGVAEWSATLPRGPVRFRAWLALQGPPIPGVRSDGATAVLSVVSGGRETEVGRLAVTPGPSFVEMKADLSAFAEQDVTLRLVTDPGASSRWDWVFVGAPAVWGPPAGEVRRVVVVGIDTTRPDHLSFFGYDRPTTPELDEVLATSAVFDRTWSVAPRTRPAFRTATTGLRPLEAVGAPSLGAVLSRHGFATGAVVANVHLQPRFGFSDGYDSWHFDGQARAGSQVDRALGWLQQHLDRDTFLFLHLMDPHLRYDAPPPWRDRFVTDPDPSMPPRVSRGQVLAWMRDGSLTDRRKAHLEALHDGELAYMSAELGRFVDEVDKLPGRTLFVFHTDHGEEFWEHGGFEHNHQLYDEVTRTLLAFRPRGGLAAGQRIDVAASLLDIAPSLYDLIGVTDGPDMHGRTLVPVLQGDVAAALRSRGLPLGHVQYRRERWGVVVQGHKYVLYTGSGREKLYDLRNDPGESRDLSAVRDLGPFREHLRHAHQIPVGPGLRVRFDDAPAFTLAWEPVARVAEVLDPETLIDHRANVEWGEVPDRLPRDVGTVTLADDGRSLTFTPGPDPDGVLVVLFDDATKLDAAATTLTVDGEPVGWSAGARGPQWKRGSATVAVSPGTVLLPPPTEADRMGIGPGAAAAAQEARMLCELGYITDCEGTTP